MACILHSSLTDGCEECHADALRDFFSITSSFEELEVESPCKDPNVPVCRSCTLRCLLAFWSSPLAGVARRRRRATPGGVQ